MVILRSALMWMWWMLAVSGLTAQDSIVLNNPSFEDSPRHSKVPVGWINCGFRNESPPDIGPTDFFRANTRASDGRTHLVMVTRDNGTWERIGNLLESPMQAGHCYTFSLDLARSPVYLSVSRVTAKGINFNVPIRLRVWGANEEGELMELLAVSPPIEHEDWQKYSFALCPLVTHSMLVFEAMYGAGAEQPYGGNILLDKCSALSLTKDLVRNEAKLSQWNAETIPRFRVKQRPLEPQKSLMEVDTMQLQNFLSDIEMGRVDIGLSELAAYAKDFAALPWIIVVEEEVSPNNKQQLRLLRKRIKAMSLRAYLSVRLAKKLPKQFRYLVEGLGWKA